MKVKIVGTPNKKSNGGNLISHGATWDTGLTYIGNGGTHEENPLGGVPSGIGANGSPNLVEEGEVIWKDQEYVFTNRKGPEDAQLKVLGFGGSKNLTYADVALKVMDRLAERPNDPIEKDGANKTLEMLKNMQEDWRSKERAKELAKFIKNLSPEEKAGMFSGMDQQSMSPEGYDNIPTDTMMNESQVPMGMEQGVPQQGQGEIAQVQGDDVMRPYAKGGPKVNVFANGDTIWKLTPSYNIYDEDFEFPMDSSPVNATADNMGGPFVNSYNIGTGYGMGKPLPYDRAKTPEYYNQIYNPNSLYMRKRDYINDVIANNKNKARQIYSTYFQNDLPNEEAWKNSYSIASKDGKKGAFHDGTLNFVLNTPSFYPKNKDDIKREVPTQNNAEDMRDTDDGYDYEQLPTWMRYAPVVGSGIGAITGLMNAIKGPDLSWEKSLRRRANEASLPHFISPTPIGNYLQFNPFDRNYFSNQLNAQANANRRAMMNNSGISRFANALAGDYNAQIGLGNLYRQGFDADNAEREKVESFNKDTNKYNSANAIEAERFNAQAMNEASQRALQNEMAIKSAVDAERNASDAAISANLTKFFDNLGNIGRENMQWNWLRNLQATGALGGDSAKMKKDLYKEKEVIRQELQKNPEATDEYLRAVSGISKEKIHKYRKDIDDERIKKEKKGNKNT